MDNALLNLEEKLKSLRTSKYDKPYFVPALWIENIENFPKVSNFRKVDEIPKTDGIGKAEAVKPAKFFLERINRIYELSNSSRINIPEHDWSKHAVIYNLFVRYATAYDHDNDGKIDNDKHYFSETGTFLKSIALLPYLHSFGINTVYMLPITSIGIDGRKGDLGSPYAIKNPYKLDENLSESILEMTIEEQFSAFVEAAHLLGMKVVLEFVFRTASKDCDMALEHPEWFYWIKEKIKDRIIGSNDEKKYGPPVFNTQELEIIKEKVFNHDLIKLPAPNKDYKDMFTSIPKEVARVQEKIIGVTGEIEKVTSRIPGAFADWPPDDIQPAWSDVTYLRLYDHPSFNYIAYNTVRMYEQRLEHNDHQIIPLWDYICSIIPYYQKTFGIDGVLIDMGHALPHELRSKIVESARIQNPNFAFWEENFMLTKKSVKDGYNAVVGYLPFDLHINYKVKSLIKMLSADGSPIPFFGTSETHNTHRSASRIGNLEFSKLTWALVNFLPTLPFILNGFELGETLPINTGLGFTTEENLDYPVEKLALFSTTKMNWDEPREFTVFVREIINLRSKYIDTNENFNTKTIQNIETSSDDIIAFLRKFKEKRIIFVANLSHTSELYFSAKVNEKYYSIFNVIDGRIINIANGWIIYHLKPFEFFIGEMSC